MPIVQFDDALNETLEDEEAPLPANLRAAANIDTQIGTSTQAAINALDSEKEDNIAAGTAGQIWQGDKTWVAKTALPISTATQTALDLKAPLASPTFTGTVSGITKSMVGLGNVDNTSDANKPISTATQAALDALDTRIGRPNLKDFGTGVGTGNGTIDTDALEDMITYLNANGGEVYIPEGDYEYEGADYLNLTKGCRGA